MTPKKIAFIHIPRTAGTYAYSYLAWILHKKGYKILNSWQKLKRDWTKGELLSFLEENGNLIVHNHSLGWEKEVFYKYKKARWFTVCFIRHPGDRLCSEYFFWNLGEKWNQSLNEFIKKRLLNPLKGNTIPEYWQDFDYIDIFDKYNYKNFLKKYFDHDYSQKKPKLESKNKGYGYYCKNQIISKETQKLLIESRDYKIYSKIANKNLSNNLKLKISNIISYFKKPRITPKTVIKYLLYEHPIISYMMKREEIEVVLESLKEVIDNKIEGDVVELGCNEGTTSLFIRRLLDYYNSNKEFHVYDSFEGLPKKGKEDYNNHPSNYKFKEGIVKIKKETLIRNFKKNKLELPKVHQVWFKDIQSNELPKKISFAFFDGDFYDSIMDSFKKIYPRLSKGGIIVIDDYGWDALPGVKRACADFLKDKPETLFTKTNEAIIIKK